MSIKLEWDFSDAPHEAEVVARNTGRTSPLTEANSQLAEPDVHQQPKALASRQRPWPWWLAGLGLLAALAGGGLWYVTQSGWQMVSNEVVSAVNYEDKQAAAGASNLLLNVQDRGNVDWLSVRRDEALARQPAPLPVPVLNFSQAPLKVSDLTALDSEFMLARVSRQFTAPDGQTLTFTLPQFYRRDSANAWVRSAPPGSFWGNWVDWQGAQLVIHYSERDAAFVSQVAPALDERLRAACAAWAGACPSQAPTRLYLSGFVGSLEYNPTSNVEVQIALGTPGGSAGSPADYFLSIPSPQIAGMPADEASYSYLADYLAVRLIASLARHVSTSPDGYYQRTAQAIQALGLARADPGYLVVGQRRRIAPGGAAQLFAQGKDGPGRRQDRLMWRVVYYTTVPGDTLASIAAHFNTSAFAIERANSIGNPDFLPAGVKLTIPLITPGSASSP